MFAKRQVGRVVRYCKDILGRDAETIVDDLIANSGCYPLRLFAGVLESENLCPVA